MKKRMLSMLFVVLFVISMGTTSAMAKSLEIKNESPSPSRQRLEEIAQAEQSFQRSHKNLERLAIGETAPDGTYYIIYGSNEEIGSTASNSIVYLLTLKKGETKFEVRNITDRFSISTKPYFQIKDILISRKDRIAITFIAYDDVEVNKTFSIDAKGNRKNYTGYSQKNSHNFALIINTEDMKLVKKVDGGITDRMQEENWSIDEKTISITEHKYPENYTTSTEPYTIKKVFHSFSLENGNIVK